MDKGNSEYYLPSKEYLTAVGARLKATRKKLGVTQKAAAQAAGISQPFLSAVERGQKAVSTAQIVSLIRFYKVPYEQIFGGLEEAGDTELPGIHSSNLGVELLEQLVGEADSNELTENAQRCLNICAYVVFRTVYRLNPHNSERPFSIPYEEIEDIAERFFKEGLKKISSVIRDSDHIKAASFELPLERNEELRAFIRECEDLMRGTDRKKK